MRARLTRGSLVDFDRYVQQLRGPEVAAAVADRRKRPGPAAQLAALVRLEQARRRERASLEDAGQR